MKLVYLDGIFRLNVSRDELLAISNCMNEALEFVPRPSFQTRVGVSRSDVLNLHTDLVAAARKAGDF